MAQPLSTTSGRLTAARSKSANRKIFRALVSLASAALLIRVMGMANQIVVSSRFGARESMDAYIIASTLPILLAQLLANPIEAAIVPTYAHVRIQGTKEQASRLFSTLLNLLIVCAAIVTLVMLLFRSQMILISAPGSASSIIAIAIDLAPVIFPVLLLMVVINYLEVILNTEGQFGWPAYAGMLVPLSTAVFVFIAGRSIGVVMLCIGMVVGLCLQLCIVLIRARRARIAYQFVVDLRTPEISKIMIAAWPVLIGALISQAGPLIDQVFASFLSQGSISALNYSLKLIGIFSGVIFASVGRAVLPYLSRLASVHDLKGFKETLRLYVWVVGIGTTLLSVFVIVLSHQLVHILFQRGAFTANDTTRTANTLIGLALGLTPMSFGFITYRAFSALGKTKMLMGATLFSIIANAVFDYFFSRIWQIEGIGLATSAMYVCSMFLLFFLLRREIGELHIFTPPSEIVDVLRRVGADLGIYRRGVQASLPLAIEGMPLEAEEEAILPWISIPYNLQQQLIRFGITIAAFAIGVAGVLVNSLYALRISLASVILLALMRYNFVLLMSWMLINGPNALPLFRGSNILIGLTVPTLLLMTSLPIKRTIKHMPVLGFLAIYLLWASFTIGSSPFGFGPSLTAWVLRLDCLAVSILAINILNTRWRILLCIDALLLVSAYISVYGIYGYITKQNGIVDPSTSLFRIVSIFNAAPGLALFLSTVIPLALYRTFTLQGFRRIIGVLLILIYMVAAGLTFTRSAYIYIPLGILITTFFLPSRQMKNAIFSGFSALAVIVVLLATVGNVPIFSRFFSQDIATLNGRTYLWEAILNNFDPRQLLGKGIRSSDALLINLHIGINGQGEIGTASHNLFLGTLYDHGIIGLILFAMVFMALGVNLIRGMRTASGEHRIVFAVALAVLVSVFLQSFDSNDFWDQTIAVYIWFIMVLPFAVYWSKPKQVPAPTEAFVDEMNQITEPRLKAVQQRESK